MSFLKRISLFFQCKKCDLIELKCTLKRRIWNKHILMWWNRLWIRKNEFHRSFSLDGEAMLEMNKKEREKYILDLVKRRDIAHQRDLKGI